MKKLHVSKLVILNYIDLILNNKKELFKNCNVLEVGISDHHNFIVTALKSQLIKGNAKIKFYWATAPFKWEMLGQRWIRISKITLTLSSLNFQTLSLE